MHNHDSNNNNGGHDMKMMWLMMLPCMLMPIIFLALSGKGLGAFSWQLFAGIALMVGIHALMMKFMHTSDAKPCHEADKKEENKETQQ